METRRRILLLSESLFESNSAEGSGGAVRLRELGSATLLATRFDGNTSLSSNGGALYADRVELGQPSGPTPTMQLTMDMLTFEDNEAASSGGAVYLVEPSRLSMSASTFSDNRANSLGGALRLRLASTDEPMVLQTLQFLSNISEGPDDSYGGIGGAVALHSPTGDGILQLHDSVFDGNVAARKAGAIRSLDLRELRITETTFSANVVTDGSAGAVEFDTNSDVPQRVLLHIEDTDFIGNQATDDGGGLWVVGGRQSDVELHDVTFDTNVASRGGGMNAASSHVSGDGVHFLSNVAGEGSALMFDGRSNVLESALLSFGDVTPASGDSGDSVVRVDGIGHPLTLSGGAWTPPLTAGITLIDASDLDLTLADTSLSGDQQLGTGVSMDDGELRISSSQFQGFQTAVDLSSAGTTLVATGGVWADNFVDVQLLESTYTPFATVDFFCDSLACVESVGPPAAPGP